MTKAAGIVLATEYFSQLWDPPVSRTWRFGGEFCNFNRMHFEGTPWAPATPTEVLGVQILEFSDDYGLLHHRRSNFILPRFRGCCFARCGQNDVQLRVEASFQSSMLRFACCENFTNENGKIWKSMKLDKKRKKRKLPVGPWFRSVLSVQILRRNHAFSGSRLFMLKRSCAMGYAN